MTCDTCVMLKSHFFFEFPGLLKKKGAHCHHHSDILRLFFATRGDHHASSQLKLNFVIRPSTFHNIHNLPENLMRHYFICSQFCYIFWWWLHSYENWYSSHGLIESMCRILHTSWVVTPKKLATCHKKVLQITDRPVAKRPYCPWSRGLSIKLTPSAACPFFCQKSVQFCWSPPPVLRVSVFDCGRLHRLHCCSVFCLNTCDCDTCVDLSKIVALSPRAHGRRRRCVPAVAFAG